MGGGAGGLLLGLACERFDYDFVIFDPCLPVLLIIPIIAKSVAILLTAKGCMVLISSRVVGRSMAALSTAQVGHTLSLPFAKLYCQPASHGTLWGSVFCP